jgi:hypothetical protein
MACLQEAIADATACAVGAAVVEPEVVVGVGDVLAPAAGAVLAVGVGVLELPVELLPPQPASSAAAVRPAASQVEVGRTFTL